MKFMLMSRSPDSCYNNSCQSLVSCQQNIAFDFYVVAVVNENDSLESAHCSGDFSSPSEKVAMIDDSRSRFSSCFFGHGCFARKPSAFRSRPLTLIASTCWSADGSIAAVDGTSGIGLMMMTRHCDCEKEIGLSRWFLWCGDAIFQLKWWIAKQPWNILGGLQCYLALIYCLTSSSQPHSPTSICSDRYCCLLLNYSLARIPSSRWLVVWPKVEDGCMQRYICHAA